MSGGFFNVENENNNNYESKKNNYEEGERKKTKMFIPVTLAMISNANSMNQEDDTFEIDGEQVNDIILCGRVSARDEQPTRSTFILNDNTGTIKCTFYNRDENVLPKYLQSFDYEEDCYVKLFGTIRMFKDVKQVVGAHLSKIEDYDVVTNHFLQVFVGSCVRQKGILGSQDFVKGEAAGAKGELTEEDKIKLVKDTASRLVEDSKSNNTGDNVTKNAIFKHLNSKLTFPEFEKVIQKLIDEMEIFEEENGAIGTF